MLTAHDDDDDDIYVPFSHLYIEIFHDNFLHKANKNFTMNLNKIILIVSNNSIS